MDISPSIVRRFCQLDELSYNTPRLRPRLLQKLLCLVDLGRKIWAAAAVGMVQEHQRAVRLAHLVFGNGLLSTQTVSAPAHHVG